MQTMKSTRSAFAAVLACLAFSPVGLAVDLGRDGPATATGSETAAAEAALPAADDARMGKLAGRVRDLRPERRIREIYDHYRQVATASGHAFELAVLDSITVPFAEFSRHTWPDLISPATGWWIDVHRLELDAPWIDGDRVHYELVWDKRSARNETSFFARLATVDGIDFRQALAGERRRGYQERIPVAVTSYRARVRFGDRERTYRAAGFWYAGDGDEPELEIHDPVVPHVASALVETSRVVTRQELDELSRPPRRAPAARTTKPSGPPSATTDQHR